MVRTVGLRANVSREKGIELVGDIIRWLEARGCRVLLDESGLLKSWPDEMIRRLDCLMVLGGDGTLLSSARIVAPHGVPIFGINLGRLGFLTEVDIPDVYDALQKLLDGRFSIEERMMLQADLVREGKKVVSMIGLNDAVITKGALARLITLETCVNDEHFVTYPADGLIISSPTGSTAYSLSAGGPLVVPQLDVMLITPICPHTLWARPLVISPEAVVKVTLLSRQSEVMLTVDGQEGVHVEYLDSVMVRRAPYRARFLKLTERTFFNILREKLKEGDPVV